jgi:hypothetical protein
MFFILTGWWDPMRAEWTLPATKDGRAMKFEGRLFGRELKPRASRVDVKYDALVRFDGAAAVDAMILNVSNKGFRLHAAEELEPGVEVMLEVETLEPVRGQIRWSCGQESGGVFLEAIAL